MTLAFSSINGKAQKAKHYFCFLRIPNWFIIPRFYITKSIISISVSIVYKEHYAIHYARLDLDVHSSLT